MKRLLLLPLIILLLSSCKKGEEPIPSLNVENVRKSLIGSWEMTSYSYVYYNDDQTVKHVEEGKDLGISSYSFTSGMVKFNFRNNSGQHKDEFPYTLTFVDDPTNWYVGRVRLDLVYGEYVSITSVPTNEMTWIVDIPNSAHYHIDGVYHHANRVVKTYKLKRL